MVLENTAYFFSINNNSNMISQSPSDTSNQVIIVFLNFEEKILYAPF